MSWSAHVVTTPPATLPVMVADVRAHCRADDAGDDDAVLSAYLAAAVDMVEAQTGSALITRTVQITRHQFAARMALPIGPVGLLSLSYLDPTGASQQLDPTLYALVGVGSLRTEIRLIAGKAWPAVLDHPAAITCTVSVGYGPTGASVPPAILQAIRLLVGDYFAQREDTIAERSVTPATMPTGVSALLANYRIW